MQYSYFIKKNLDFIQNNGYLIYPNGSQAYKKSGNFEILITDLTGEKILFDRFVCVLVWIKDSNTDEIQFEKAFKGDIIYPKMKKIDKIINKKILILEKNIH